MDINESFRSAYGVVTTETKGILPFYFIGMGVPAVLRVSYLVTAALVYLALLRREAIAEVNDILESIDVEEFEQNPEPLAERYAEEFDRIAELLFVPEVITIITVSLAVTVVLAIVLNGVVGAGKVHALYSAFTDDDPVRDGVSGIARDASTFILLSVVEIGAILTVLSVLSVFGLVVTSLLGGALAAVVGFLFLLIILFAVLAVHMLFVFAPQSVVIEDKGAAEAIKRNVDFVRDNPVEFVAYIIFFFAAGIGISTISGFFGALGAPVAFAVIWFMAFSPFIGAVKVDMYTRYSKGGDEIAFQPVEPTTDRVVDALRRGLRETADFTKSALPYLAIVLAVFFGSIAFTRLYLSAAEIGFETSIARRIEATSPLGSFVNYSTNNWMVAIAQSYAGLAVAIPALVSVFYNGALLGFFMATEVDLVEFIAFVVPHGLIEMPAFLVSGALGLHLGVVVWKHIRGRLSRDELSDEIERAYHVLLGLGVLFVVAGFVESFFSPYYYRLFLTSTFDVVL